MSEAKSRKIMVTGAEGMLGQDLVKRLERLDGVTLERATIDDLDITNLGAVRERIQAVRPDIVIHCAAYTAVDQAEQEQLQAYLVNAGGAKNVAIFCREFDAELIYISTDYVFNGGNKEGYAEDDETDPINTYGATKLAGEQFIRELVPKHKICRTSWLCGIHGGNFIETILNLASRQKTLSVINDQIGRPTFTVDLADLLAQLLGVEEYGVFHTTNSGFCSWYEFAQKIIELAGLDDIRVRPITTAEFRSMARRPQYSVLEDTRLAGLGIAPAPRWEDGLERYMASRRIDDAIVY